MPNIRGMVRWITVYALIDYCVVVTLMFIRSFK